MNIARKITMALILTSTSISGLIAQENTCASGHIHDQLMLGDSLYARNMFYLNRRILEMQAEFDQRAFEVVYTIPTVIHIFHEGEELGLGSNISDEQILSAMEALNEDFRKITGSNGDGEGVDVEVEFCLASRDPDGNSTNGIIRVDASVIADYAEMGIEASSSVGGDEGQVKALSTWPREDYLNVWIVNEIEDNDGGGGIQGYAYFPINSPLDGIVVLHNAFGTTGNLKPNTALNRTFTHEVGHYIGLYHTFYDTDDCDDETNCVTQGDRVCDTPDTPLNASCWNPECDATQQVENYMDYTAEACRNMFSDGQKDRMRATLETDRATLLSSLGCIPVNDFDAGISNITSPNGSVCDMAVSPIVVLTNYGSVELTSATIVYDLSGGASLSYDWTGSISPGLSTEVTLPSIIGAAGPHTLNVESISPNGQSDQYTNNDGLSKEFNISSGSTITLNITVDYFGAETTWDVYDDQGNLVDEGGPYINNNQGTMFSESICATAGCFTLSMHDTYGDGQSFTNGYYELLDGDGNVLASGTGNWGYDDVNDFCIEDNGDGQAPTANFGASDTGVCLGEGVNFFDLSLDNPSSWSWTFEGGSPSFYSGPTPPPIVYSNAGTYDITLVVSNNDGTDSYSLNNYINVYDDPSIDLTIQHVSCAGDTDGSISSQVNGFGSIIYDWSTGNTGPSISAVGTGIYSLSVTDAQGCVASANATINEPNSINLNVSSFNLSCYGQEDGSAAASASGGVGNIVLAWSNGSSNTVINNLTAGNYTVIATDENGCSVSVSVTVSEPQVLLSNLFDFDIACNGGLGSAEVDPTGGTTPYVISWSTGENATVINNLNPNNYSVGVEDANGCTASDEFEITETAELTVQLNVDDISCNGMTDGAAQVNVMGGTGNYTYAWSTGHTWTSVSGLGAGSYFVEAEDDAGCSGSVEFILTEPEVLSVTIFKTDISCYALNDGTATATVSGGTPPYIYNWDNGHQSNQATGLSQGTSVVTVTDDRGCNMSESVEIIEPSALVVTTQQSSPETCFGNDGSGLANTMGGTPDYSIAWSNGSEEQILSNVTSGSYVVTVTDGNGCQSNADLQIIYECENPPQATVLTDEFCEAHNLFLDQFIECIAVENAEMYQWKFENSSSGVFTEEYTAANNPTFYLADVQELGYDMVIEVSIKVLRDGMWSPYGDVCQIWTDETIPSTELIDDDCGSTGLYFGDFIESNEVEGAFAYEWHLTGQELDAVFITYVNSLALTSGIGLIPGGLYSVQIRVQIAGEWSEWGSSCSIELELDNGIDDLFGDDLAVSIYPNPNAGDQITFELSKLSDNPSVIHFELYSSAGKLIETFELLESTDNYMRTEHRFQNRLSSGMYFIKYELNGNRNEEKLIVK